MFLIHFTKIRVKTLPRDTLAFKKAWRHSVLGALNFARRGKHLTEEI